MRPRRQVPARGRHTGGGTEQAHGRSGTQPGPQRDDGGRASGMSPSGAARGARLALGPREIDGSAGERKDARAQGIRRWGQDTGYRDPRQAQRPSLLNGVPQRRWRHRLGGRGKLDERRQARQRREIDRRDPHHRRGHRHGDRRGRCGRATGMETGGGPGTEAGRLGTETCMLGTETGRLGTETCTLGTDPGTETGTAGVETWGISPVLGLWWAAGAGDAAARPPAGARRPARARPRPRQRPRRAAGVVGARRRPLRTRWARSPRRPATTPPGPRRRRRLRRRRPPAVPPTGRPGPASSG